MKYKIDCGVSRGAIKYYVKRKILLFWITIYSSDWIEGAEIVVKKLIAEPKYYDSKKQKS